MHILYRERCSGFPRGELTLRRLEAGLHRFRRKVMKRIVLMALLAMALPLAAFASGVDFTNSGGTLTGSSGGLSLTGSDLIAVNGLNGLGLVTGNDLGSLSFSTGSLISGGSLQMGGSFKGGGSFIITGNGTRGIPNTTLFNGSFTGPVNDRLKSVVFGMP